LLVRAGIGSIRIIDKDCAEYHNLHRQVLFDEEDVKSWLPKVVAAERRLKKVNSSVEIKGIVAEVTPSNVEGLVSGADLIMDGLDNTETRYLLNDVSLKHKIPWVYGGVVGASGMTMNIIPGKTPCLRCVFPFPARSQSNMAISASGIIGPAPFVIGSWQVTEAIKILTNSEDINKDIINIDIWRGTCQRFKIKPGEDCPACHGNYEYLEEKTGA